jgi:putative ABC transport system permease protein
LRRYLRFWGPDVDADVADELRHHLEMRESDFLARGFSPSEAHEAALRSFGDVDVVSRMLRDHDRSKLRHERRADMLQDLVYDVRYGLRQLWAVPHFTAAVVLVLALGIGANTATFSAIDVAFFRPLPFVTPERLVALADVDLPFSRAGLGQLPVTQKSRAELSDFRADSAVFSRVAAYAGHGGLNLVGGAEPARVTIAYVTDDFFETLGRAAAKGRLPTADEFTTGGPKAVVISHSLWLQQFGGDRTALGKTVTLNATPYRVVGVMPNDFRFPAATDVWIPLPLPFTFDVIQAFRNFLPLAAVARLAPGVSVAVAAQHADAIRRHFRTPGPDDVPVSELAIPLQRSLLGDRRTGLLILAGSAALLLLIACANVTNLLLSRAATREREIAVRIVLGATRARLLRQLLIESLLLSLGGATIAIGVGMLSLNVLANALPMALASVTAPRIDLRVLMFTLAFAIVTSVLFGLWPALGASRADLGVTMKLAGAGGGGSQRGGIRVRGVLVVAEVSLAVMLLVGAGLMIESLHTLLRTDSGVRAEHVATGRLTLPAARYRGVATSAFIDAVLARLRATPGVQSAAAVNALPMEGAGGIALRVAPAEAYDEAHSIIGAYLVATPGYFSVMGVPLRGADLPAHADGAHKVAVINATMAKALWPNGDAIGRQLAFGPERRTVIGVVGDIRTKRLDTAATAQMYFPMSEQPQSYASIVARGNAQSSALLSGLQNAVRATDPLQPVYALRTMDDVIAATVTPQRTNTILLATFGLVAMLLAAIGVYAVLAYSVAQRTREIGVRVALGAQRRDVVALILRQGSTLTLIGLTIGLVGAYVLSRLLESMLYQVNAHDGLVFAASASALALVAMLATLAPALRATRVDPITALRHD